MNPTYMLNTDMVDIRVDKSYTVQSKKMQNLERFTQSRHNS